MDEVAWSDLQSDFFRRIYFFVKRQVGSHQTAEDLTQEVFLGAVKSIERFDTSYTIEQFLFGIARNRVVDHFRKHRPISVPSKRDDDSDASLLWLENFANDAVSAPAEKAVDDEKARRQRVVLGEILRRLVAELWESGDFQKLMVLESLFVLGNRNKDVADRFGYEDEKAIAGIKFRAIDRLRGWARQRDPNHSLFLGLWSPGSR